MLGIFFWGNSATKFSLEDASQRHLKDATNIPTKGGCFATQSKSLVEQDNLSCWLYTSILLWHRYRLLLIFSFRLAQPLALIYNPTPPPHSIMQSPSGAVKAEWEIYACPAPLLPPRQPAGMDLLLPVSWHFNKLSGNSHCCIKTASWIIREKVEPTVESSWSAWLFVVSQLMVLEVVPVHSIPGPS